ncbi:hypothetical protein A0H81_02890 [Grifola frondosa]|uniref:DUF6589 domain-containing protein n=1 Tax=Grifola frondosa TaxID=5627 RepID=A0A1C7ML88_GRIFR|nr:hypothetical protein A0H81_02890 [Grifola frondosa]
MDIAKMALRRDITELAKVKHGFHFNASKAAASYLEGSFMHEAAEKMKTSSPTLWDFVHSLLDANDSRRRTTPNIDSDVEMELEDREMDLGDFARNATLLTIKTVITISIFLQSTNERCNYLQSILGIFYHSTSVPEKVIETLAHAGLSISLSLIHNAISSLSRGASAKIKSTMRSLTASFAYDNFDINFKTAQPTLEHQLTFVSATSATAIPLFGVDDPSVLRCSEAFWLQDPLNPELTGGASAQSGMDDTRGIFRDLMRDDAKKAREARLSPWLMRFAWHIHDILVKHGEHFGHLEKELEEPEPIDVIPLHKTSQVPCRAMKIKQSTTDGNIQVLDSLFQQGGIGESGGKGFAAEYGDVDMSEWVIFVHGDLLTKERIDSVQESRAIEDSPKRRFQYVVFLPGLFHYKIACADAFWRTWAQPKEARTDVNSLYEHVGILRPDETGKFVSNPGFRRVHDVIHHDAWGSMLDCWRLEAEARNPEWTSLKIFSESKPSWDLITEMSESIVTKYVATTPKLSDLRDEPMQERDEQFENQCLWNRDELLYIELCHAMNAGDIGRVEASFIPWTYIFKATGKHKYASQILRFMKDLRDKYPTELRKIIRMNWLINPTGKLHACRGIDWLVERNNLYTKVIHAGGSSNKTIEHIIKESVLIEMYRECHTTIENGFISNTAQSVTHLPTWSKHYEN